MTLALWLSPQPPGHERIQLDIFRSLRGWTGDWSRCSAQAREMGAVGVETRLPLETDAQRAMAHALAQHGLACIAVVFTGGGVIPHQGWTVERRLQRLREALDDAACEQLRTVRVLTPVVQPAAARPGQPLALEMRNITSRYGNQTVLNRIHLSVAPGDVVS